LTVLANLNFYDSRMGMVLDALQSDLC